MGRRVKWAPDLTMNYSTHLHQCQTYSCSPRQVTANPGSMMISVPDQLLWPQDPDPPKCQTVFYSPSLQTGPWCLRLQAKCHGPRLASALGQMLQAQTLDHQSVPEPSWLLRTQFSSPSSQIQEPDTPQWKQAPGTCRHKTSTRLHGAQLPGLLTSWPRFIRVCPKTPAASLPKESTRHLTQNLWMKSLSCKGISLPKPVCKNWKRCLFPQVPRYQCKTTRIIINQGNIIPSKEINKAPVIDPKQMAICLTKTSE